MVEIRGSKKKRAPPPPKKTGAPTQSIVPTQNAVHAKTASVGSVDSGISGGNKSPPESRKNAPKKKRAPLPPPIMARKLSQTRGAVLMPGAGKNLIYVMRH